MSQSANSAGSQRRTTSSPSSRDMGCACFHRTACRYDLPADLSEAPTACNVKCGCCASRSMKRWPTEPVAPSTPAKETNVSQTFGRDRGIGCKSGDTTTRDSPHRFFGKSGFRSVKCSTSMVAQAFAAVHSKHQEVRVSMTHNKNRSRALYHGSERLRSITLHLQNPNPPPTSFFAVTIITHCDWPTA